MQNSNNKTRRYNFCTKKINEAIEIVNENLFQKRGFFDSLLIKNWKGIVGEDTFELLKLVKCINKVNLIEVNVSTSDLNLWSNWKYIEKPIISKIENILGKKIKIRINIINPNC